MASSGAMAMVIPILVADWLAQLVNDASAQLIDVRPGQLTAEDHDEIVTTQPRDQILAAGALQQALGHFLQHRIAGGVTQIVIDRLETIQVETEVADTKKPGRKTCRALGCCG